MLTLIGYRKWRPSAVVLLASPAVSVLAAAAVVWANGNVLSRIPLGVHKLVPLAVLVPMLVPVLAAAAAVGLLLATAPLASGPSGDRAGRVSAAEVVVLS